MHRTPIALAALTAAALGLGALAAPAGIAAPPPPPDKPDGAVSPASREYTWTSEPVVMFGPWGEVEEMQCLDPSVAEDVCDFEYVQVDLPPAGEATIEFGFVPQGTIPPDFDLAVYDPDGRVIGTGTGSVVDGGETVRARVKKAGVYTVEIAHYTSLGSTYEGFVKMK